MLFKWLLCVLILIICQEFSVYRFIASATEECDFVPCEKEWYFFGNMYYKLGGRRANTRLDWNKASERCAEEGGHLATVSSKEVHEFLVAFILLDIKTHVWIGLNDQANESLYEWDDGSDSEFRNWRPGEPSGPALEKEDCVQMIYEPWMRTAGDWNDNECTKEMPFICQKESSSAKRMPDPRMCSKELGSGWKLGTSCYNLVMEKKNWHDAEQHCVEKYGGHLTSVREMAVDLFIDYFLAKFDKEIWIGIKLRDDIQQKWTSGFHVAYSDWKSDTQEFIEGNCAIRVRSNLWDSLPCSRELSFICEVSKDRPPSLPAPPKGAYCPPQPEIWRDLDGYYCYFFETSIKVNWNEANFECARRGGHLASIHSKEETEVLQPFVIYKRYTVFIGLVKLKTHEEMFAWTDGSQLDYLNWGVNEPSKEEEVCTELWTSSMLWNDCNCSGTAGYICSVRKILPNTTFIDPHENCISTKALIGICVCVSLLIILLGVLVYYFWSHEDRRKKSTAQNPKTPNLPTSERPRYRCSEMIIKEDDYYEDVSYT